MIDVRSIANSVTSSINPNDRVTIRVSTGYAFGSGRKQVPTYNDVCGYDNQFYKLD